MNPPDKLQTAEQLLKDERYGDAYAAYLPLAEEGQLEAQIMLGWMKENGQGVSRDLTGALEWYRKAAERESSVAQFYLGAILMQTGAHSEALLWYKKSAAAEYMPAVYRLAWAYESGRGTSIDKDQALTLFKQNANRGHLPSKMALAQKMFQGTQGHFMRLWGLYEVLKTYLMTVVVAWKDMRDDRIRL